jgi:hypothetical protein
MRPSQILPATIPCARVRRSGHQNHPTRLVGATSGGVGTAPQQKAACNDGRKGRVRHGRIVSMARSRRLASRRNGTTRQFVDPFLRAAAENRRGAHWDGARSKTAKRSKPIQRVPIRVKSSAIQPIGPHSRETIEGTTERAREPSVPFVSPSPRQGASSVVSSRDDGKVEV